MLGYTDDLAPGDDGPAVAIKDPTRIGPAFWFQQMDEPRTERNRFHIDVIVPHEIAQERIDAARAAGGVVVTVRPVVVGAGRRRGQRSLCLHLAGPRVGVWFATRGDPRTTAAASIGSRVHTSLGCGRHPRVR